MIDDENGPSDYFSSIHDNEELQVVNRNFSSTTTTVTAQSNYTDAEQFSTAFSVTNSPNAKSKTSSISRRLFYDDKDDVAPFNY